MNIRSFGIDHFWYFICTVGNEVTAIEEASGKSVIIGKKFNCEQEAYDFFNDYGYSKGFSVRVGKSKRRDKDKTLKMKRFVCSNEGHKDDKCERSRSYERLETRTGCGAFVHFNIDREGVWLCTRHNMVHNHPMIPVEKRHLLRSQRVLDKDYIRFLSTLRSSGVKVADCFRALKKEVGGSPNLGFTIGDAYNALQIEKAATIDGYDSHQLIKYFAQRQFDDSEFYYDFEQDETGSLISFFWRDGRMKRDYIYFGDLLVFDTTYRTNKYGMICAPFVGMNHHGNNVMFGMGFLVNERTQSFDWLFDTFLTSMGGKSPVTIMTDQAPSIAAGIRNSFSKSTHHRLCLWHIEQNSKKHIASLRALDGFLDLFNYLLKYCETPAEFEHYWKRFVMYLLFFKMFNIYDHLFI